MSYLKEDIEGLNLSLEENKHKLSSAHLDYVQEVLPFQDKDILIDRIDEICDSIPPKAIDSNKEISELIASYKEEINPIYLEAPQDAVQIEQISETMTRMEDLEFSEWKELSFNERVDVLQRVENEVSRIAHRPACPIQTENLGKGYFGYYAPESKTITINSNYIQSNEISDYKEVLDTIIHEGRHAYQYYNLTGREVHPRQGDLSNWKANEFEYGYQDVAFYGFKAYEMQPLETDARSFAENVLNNYNNRIS